MKIELDLSADQLSMLDTGLTDLLKNLTEEQKISILQTYFLREFQGIRYSEKNEYGYYTRRDELSDFGKAIVKGLQEKISDSVSNKILEDENLQKELKRIEENLVNQLPNILSKSINTYILENLFTNRSHICDISTDIIRQENMRNANKYY